MWYPQADLQDQYHRRIPSPGPEGGQDQRGLYLRYSPFEIDLPGYPEYSEKMDIAFAKLGFDHTQALSEKISVPNEMVI